jgi:flagellar biosynthesis protein FliR
MNVLDQTVGQMAQRLNLDIDVYFVIALVGLILARTIPMMALTPIFGGKLVTAQIKVGIAIILMVTIYPTVAPLVQGKLPVQGLAYWGLVFKEFAIGSMIGFVSSLVYHAIESSGHLIDIQRGSAQASVLVPQLDIQGPIFANLQIQLCTLLFFTLNLHHVFIRGFFDSFQMIPVNQYPEMMPHFLPFIEQVIHMSGAIFVVAMQLTGPILLSIFMVDVVFGVMNRIAPMVNVYFLAMPVKAVVGIIMFLASFGLILKYMATLFAQMLLQLRVLIHYLG